MNKKLIIWTLGIIILSSFALASLETDFPDFLKKSQILTAEEESRLSEFVEENPTIILENGELNVYTIEEWMTELSNTPPAQYQTNLANLDTSLSQYFQTYNVPHEAQTQIQLYPDEQKSQLLGSLGRARENKAMIVYYMLDNSEPELSRYIINHELFHTFTNPMFTAENQANEVSNKLAQSSNEGQAELMEKLNFLNQESLLLDLWKEHVGNEDTIFFSNYQPNLREQLSEYYARLTTASFFADDLESYDADVNTQQTEGYISAFIIADRYNLFETYDGEKGQEIKEEIIEIIEKDPDKKTIYDQKDMAIIDETSVQLPESPLESGEYYECQYESEGNNLEIVDCQLTSVSELAWTPDKESVSFAYDKNGKIIDATFFDGGDYVVKNFENPFNSVVAESERYTYHDQVTVRVPSDAASFSVVTPNPFDASSNIEQKEPNPRTVSRKSAAKSQGLDPGSFESQMQILEAKTDSIIHIFESPSQCIFISSDEVKTPISEVGNLKTTIQTFRENQQELQNQKNTFTELATNVIEDYDDQAREEFLAMLNIELNQEDLIEMKMNQIVSLLDSIKNDLGGEVIEINIPANNQDDQGEDITNNDESTETTKVIGHEVCCCDFQVTYECSCDSDKLGEKPGAWDIPEPVIPGGTFIYPPEGSPTNELYNIEGRVNPTSMRNPDTDYFGANTVTCKFTARSKVGDCPNPESDCEGSSCEKCESYKNNEGSDPNNPGIAGIINSETGKCINAAKAKCPENATFECKNIVDWSSGDCTFESLCKEEIKPISTPT
ncbi:hypothetical protein ACFLZB_04960, partial [Nanoarchaeota archaeon]